MTFDWSEYYKLSKELAGQTTGSSTEEARLRSAISRAYYAVFCTARNYWSVKENKPITRSGQEHGAVCDWFLSRSDHLSKDIGEHLDQLRRYRNKADYDDTFDRLHSDAKKALDRANQALHQLSKLK